MSSVRASAHRSPTRREYGPFNLPDAPDTQRLVQQIVALLRRTGYSPLTFRTDDTRRPSITVVGVRGKQPKQETFS